MKSRKSLLLSIFIWGSGQFFNMQAACEGNSVFFVQALVIGIELQTGYWLEWLTGKIPVFELRLCGGFSREESGDSLHWERGRGLRRAIIP